MALLTYSWHGIYCLGLCLVLEVTMSFIGFLDAIIIALQFSSDQALFLFFSFCPITFFPTGVSRTVFLRWLLLDPVFFSPVRPCDQFGTHWITSVMGGPLCHCLGEFYGLDSRVSESLLLIPPYICSQGMQVSPMIIDSPLFIEHFPFVDFNPNLATPLG